MAEAKLVNVGNFYNLILSVWRSYKNLTGPNGEALGEASQAAMGVTRDLALEKLIKTASILNETRKADSFMSSVIEEAIREAETIYGENGNLMSLSNTFSQISMAVLSKGFHVKASEDIANNCDELSAFFSELAEGNVHIVKFLDSKITVKDTYGVKSLAFVDGEEPSKQTKNNIDPALAKRRLEAVMEVSTREMIKLMARTLKPYLVEALVGDVKGATPTKVEKAIDKFIDEYGM